MAGFLDRNGVVVIPPLYERVENFYEGLAIVIDKGLAGFIGRDDHAVITPRFQSDESLLIKDFDLFCEALAPARKDGLWGYIDRTESLRSMLNTNRQNISEADVLESYGMESGLMSTERQICSGPTARLTFCEGLTSVVGPK